MPGILKVPAVGAVRPVAPAVWYKHKSSIGDCQENFNNW
nr:MAG TPA: hypothetical protein [Caudoviricetes sp.]